MASFFACFVIGLAKKTMEPPDDRESVGYILHNLITLDYGTTTPHLSSPPLPLPDWVVCNFAKASVADACFVSQT